MKYYIGIDLGGTEIKAGVVDENYKILSKAGVPTNCPRPANEIVKDMCRAALIAVEKAGLTKDQIEWIGVGTPGTADVEKGVVEYANNLGFSFVPLADMMKEIIDLPVHIANDANAAVYGEALAGCAKDVQNVVGITLGTGVGGGIIIDGKIYCGFNFAGAELGHIVIEYNGRPCTCGRKGCWEAYSSATGLINMTKESMQAHPDSKMWEIAGSLDKVNGRTAYDGMRAGDKDAIAVVDMYVEYLGCGLANIVNIFQPEILFIGGGISKEGETLLRPLRAILERECYSVNENRRTKLVCATLGNDAGLIGAAMLGKLA